jgi:hypothetical protein
MRGISRREIIAAPLVALAVTACGKREEVAEKLSARGCPVDHATVEAMRRYNT